MTCSCATRYSLLASTLALFCSQVAAQSSKSTQTRVEAVETGLASAAAQIENCRLVEGAILAWSGSVARVPDGWAICDGRYGTPDLRECFLRGAATDDDVGRRGGAQWHTHSGQHQHPIQIPAHSHLVAGVAKEKTEISPRHTHEIGMSSGEGIPMEGGFGGEMMAAAAHNHFPREGRSHNHLLQIPSWHTRSEDDSSFTSSDAALLVSGDNVPPYYALCYIMKLPTKPDVGAASLAAPPAVVASSRGMPERVGTLEQRTEHLATLITQMGLARYTLPAGLIIGWRGSLSSLAGSWLPCNGASWTPDLRGRFLFGATGPKDLGHAAGAETHTQRLHGHQHTFTMPPHNHQLLEADLETDPIPDHVHAMTSGAADFTSRGIRHQYAANPAHNHTISPAGGHSHGLRLAARETTFPDGTEIGGITRNTGNPSADLAPAIHLPPYYQLHFVLKQDDASTVSLAAATKAAKTHLGIASRVETAETQAEALSSSLETIMNDFIPPGAIAVWWGTPDTVPVGWVPCDGTGNAPDLRGKFIIGAAGESGEPCGVGQQGGSVTHAHSSWGPHRHERAFFPHSHHPVGAVLRTLTRPEENLGMGTGHTHNDVWGVQFVDGNSLGDDMATPWLHGHLPGMYDVTTEHEHDIAVEQSVVPASEDLQSDTSEAQDDGPTSTAENLPPFLRVLFIMKVPELVDDRSTR